ncbi:hypothetical protein BV898_00956 [Hypsibius exemplaris]|uniref:Uncharacterized protein n=1 Tax=Hypsibius exemplaris TaxID=2072580 RepID=A0A1W0XD22_HYPEX|nr:hypothetical protein BV898_00956 [Hypsibius exemplaris]
MAKRKTIVRSASDGQLTTRPLYPHHVPKPHIRSDLFEGRPHAPRSSYGSCRRSSDGNNHHEPQRINCGSYWSPAISEIDYHLQPLGTSSLNRRVRLLRLICLLIQMSVVITQTTATTSASRPFSIASADGTTFAFPILAAFYSAACLSALLAPLILPRLSETSVWIITSLSTLTYTISPLIWVNVWSILAGSLVCGCFFGLLIVQQGVASLNLGLAFSCVKSLKGQKKTAGAWWLRTQVVVQCAGLAGSIAWSAVSVAATVSSANEDGPLSVERRCGKMVCQTVSARQPRLQQPPYNWTVEAENAGSSRGENGMRLDVIDANILLGLIAGAAALTASLCAAVAFCLSKLANPRRPHRNDGNNRSPALLSSTTTAEPENGEEEGEEEDERRLALSASSETTVTTQIYSEPPGRQLASLARVLLHDHKLQTMLPLTFFLGVQRAFITTTFVKDFIACALQTPFVGWTLAVHSGFYAGTLWIIYQYSRHAKRLYILFWIVLFQIGAGTVVIVWTPKSHDKAMFFIIAAVFGLVEGGLSALLSGLQVRVFAHDWTGTYSYLVSFKFAGSVMGLCSSIFLCSVAQMYLMSSILLVALVPYCLLEWKYNSYLRKRKRRPSKGENFL